MGQVITSSSECHIDTLTDDALIIIFSFLTLYERLMVMRVSKRCHRILSNPQVWTHVDFWQEQQMTMPRKKLIASRYRKAWMFPNDQESVLDFLKKYTGGSLKSIYLNVVSRDILTHLKIHCGNLETISFLLANDPPDTADLSDSLVTPLYFPEMMHLPKTIKMCEFSMGKTNGLQTEKVMILLWKKLIICFANCTNLWRLKLNEVSLSQEGCVALSDSNMTDLSLFNTRVAGGPDHQLNTVLMPLHKLTKIKSFRFSTNAPEKTQTWVNLDKFVRGISDQWHKLRCLSLIGIQALSYETFALMTSALTQLQILELYGNTITDENISLIAKHLKKVTILKLTDGIYTPIGIRVLDGHPSIEKLYLLQNQQLQPSPEWLLAAYDVILSLPKIAYVKLIGYRIIALHAKEKIPKMTKDVEIQVENPEVRSTSFWDMLPGFD
ncbi:uncharacterized protein [Amphiura filiformis]|uniref:uncharacterized protein n=1 Tax=Amphiura filiformis TaxID=82378 RepID=UPI003B21FEAC